MATYPSLHSHWPLHQDQVSLRHDRRNVEYNIIGVPRSVSSIAQARRELLPISKHDSLFIRFKSLFDIGWKHPGTAATVTAVYLWGQKEKSLASSPSDPLSLRSDYYFHGTRRSCSIGDYGLQPCHNSDCNLCSILRDSFKLSRADSAGMFGPGIYTTPISSKADLYAKNHHLRSSQHAMLLCRVKCSWPQPLYQPDKTRRKPDPGFDAVRAVTRDKGGSVDYPEIIVYDEKAIVPCGLIMYTREGWMPR